MYVKTEELGPIGGGVHPARPLDLPMLIIMMVSCVVCCVVCKLLTISYDIIK